MVLLRSTGKITSLHSATRVDWFSTKYFSNCFLAVGRSTRIPFSDMACMHWLIASTNGHRRPAWKICSLNFSFHLGFAVFCMPMNLVRTCTFK